MILIISAYLLINSCRNNNGNSLYTRFDESNRKSTLFLSKNDVIVDSIKNIGSYYRKDSIVKKNENRWDYFYHGRCGTGCSLVYCMNISSLNNKIKVTLHVLYKSKESDSNYQISQLKSIFPIFRLKKMIFQKLLKIMES